MPGCGKSTIGRQLARMRQLPFLDADHEIERFIGCSIRDFFEREGEPAFRDIEERVIAELLESKDKSVIATGGGAILRESTRKALHAKSTAVYLRATPDDLARRLSRDTQRPLLQVADPRQRLRDLFAQRDPFYRETAHLIVDTGHKSATLLVNLLSMQLDMQQGPAQDVE
jgi:shikimate kinase